MNNSNKMKFETQKVMKIKKTPHACKVVPFTDEHWAHSPFDPLIKGALK